MDTPLPPLPDLPIDAILEICTHTSLSGLGFSDNTKLAVVGYPYARASICQILVASYPRLSATEIEEKCRIWLSNPYVLNLVDLYGLNGKLRTAPEVRQQVMTSPMVGLR